MPKSINDSQHSFYTQSAQNLSLIPEESIQLVVTSPPYPMIQMWDDCFAAQNPDIEEALSRANGQKAFKLMHELLTLTWQELWRVVSKGGFVCINIGDALRTIGKEFCLYPNRMQIEKTMYELGFQELPCVLWRKPTNAPNKFMGSGMLPAGAYVTLEHEYILIFKKPGKRDFSQENKKRLRLQSAIFWEERNIFYSDIWQLSGEKQLLNKANRQRSGAFPFSLAYRLICMYSVIEDKVLDPFCGTGTTACASASLARHSLNFEIDESLLKIAEEALVNSIEKSAEINRSRLQAHINFCNQSKALGKNLRYYNKNYSFPLKTAQETELIIPLPKDCKKVAAHQFAVSYENNFNLSFSTQPA